MLTLIQNDHEVPSGSLLEWLHEFQLPHRIIRPYSGELLPSIHEVSALVILGGAMGVHDSDRYPYLSSVSAVIRQAIHRHVPLLGVCLGGQLLADALGAKVHSQSNGEMGLHSVTVLESAKTDPLFLGVPKDFATFQWHNDCFDVPAAAVCLASSPACAHQAFRYGANLYGLQFHPEVTKEIIASWIESSEGKNDNMQILEDFVSAEETYRKVSRRLLKNFLRIAQLLP